MNKSYQEFKDDVIKLEEEALKHITAPQEKDMVAAIIKKYEEEIKNDNK